MTTKPLTTRQMRIVVFIGDYIEGHGWAPTYDEIRVGVGLRSKSVIGYQLDALEARGHPANLKAVRRRPRLVNPCGTEQAWQRHRRAKQACELCEIQHDNRKALQAKARIEAGRRRRFMGGAA